jgi:HEAT repeat protein
MPPETRPSLSPDEASLLGVAMTRPELERTLRLFSLFFLTSLVFVVGRSARDALFLTKYPVTWVAPMWIAYGVSSSIVALGYARIADRVSRARFAIGFALFGAASYVALRAAMFFELRAAYAVFYVWSDIISNLLTAVMWTLAQDLHDARSAKRLFGLVGAGQVAGTIVCGFAVSAVVGAVGTENLIVVIACALVAIAWLTRALAQRFPLPRAPERREALPPRERLPIWRSRYAAAIAVMTLTLFAVLTIGDYQFKAIARTTFPDREDFARFSGTFYGVLGLLGLGLQIAVTPRLLQRFGVLAGMLVMPLAFFAATIGLIAHPSMALATVLKGSDNGLQFTVFDATMQLLYFPFPAAVRPRVRTLVSAIAKPVGCSLGAAILIFVTRDAPGPGASLIVSAAHLGWLTLPLGALAIALTVVVRGGYVLALRRTLIQRETEPAEVERGPTVMRVLREALYSDDAPQVIFAVEQLRPLDLDLVRSALPDLAKHRSARVRGLALRLSVELDVPGGAELARRGVEDRSASVRVTAVEVLAQILQEDAHEDLLRLCDAHDPGVRAAAIASLVRYCGLDGMLDGAPRLRALLESEEARDRIAAARVLAMVGEAQLQRALARLLRDDDPHVRKAAVEAASKVGDVRLLPLLFEAIGARPLAAAAARAITALGPSGVPAIAARLADEGAPRAARVTLPRVLFHIGTRAALDALLTRLDEPDELVRQKVLASASRLRLSLRAPAVALSHLRARIEREIADHVALRDGYLDVRAVVRRPLLDQHIVLRLRKSAIRMLRLFELAYPREVVASVRTHVFGSDPALRANALEVLESLLDKDLRSRFIALVERLGRLRAGDYSSRRSATRDEVAAWLRAEITQRDPYRAVLALDAIAYNHVREAGLDALACTAHHDPLVREVAAIAVAATEPEGAHVTLAHLLDDPDEAVADYACYYAKTGSAGISEADLMYTTIEKILFLQRVPVFANVEGEDLVTLARGATVVPMQRGDLVFKQGETGGALYFVISGAVRLAVDGREVALLGANDVFGEMSIFDNERRATTASVAEDAELLRVSADDFHEAVRETVEIAEAVIRVLYRRLREADRRLVTMGAPLPPPELEPPRAIVETDLE